MPLMVVRRVRIGHQHRRTTGRGELRDVDPVPEGLVDDVEAVLVGKLMQGLLALRQPARFDDVT